MSFLFCWLATSFGQLFKIFHLLECGANIFVRDNYGVSMQFHLKKLWLYAEFFKIHILAFAIMGAQRGKSKDY